MKSYEVIREEFVPCTGDQRPNTREILELRLEDPARYVQEQYMRERSVEFLATEQNGSPVIEALLEGGRKYRYIFRGLRMGPAERLVPSCCRAFLFSSPLLISVAFRRPL